MCSTKLFFWFVSGNWAIAEKLLSPENEDTNPDLSETGALTVVAPEPGTFGLSLLAIRFALVVRKRSAWRFQQTVERSALVREMFRNPISSCTSEN